MQSIRTNVHRAASSVCLCLTEWRTRRTAAGTAAQSQLDRSAVVNADDGTISADVIGEGWVDAAAASAAWRRRHEVAVLVLPCDLFRRRCHARAVAERSEGAVVVDVRDRLVERVRRVDGLQLRLLLRLAVRPPLREGHGADLPGSLARRRRGGGRQRRQAARGHPARGVGVRTHVVYHLHLVQPAVDVDATVGEDAAQLVGVQHGGGVEGRHEAHVTVRRHLQDGRLVRVVDHAADETLVVEGSLEAQRAGEVSMRRVRGRAHHEPRVHRQRTPSRHVRELVDAARVDHVERPDAAEARRRLVGAN